MQIPLTAALAVASVTTAAEQAVISGRILDERGDPCARTPIEVQVESLFRRDRWWQTDQLDTQRLHTDEEGRFTFPLKASWEEGKRLLVSFQRSNSDEPWHTLGETTCELSSEPIDGTNDLGSVVLPSFPPAPWTGLLDDALLRRLQTSSECWRTLRRGRREWESTMLDAARRGGALMEDALAKELATSRLAGDTSAHDVEDLEPLMALRRAQHQPDPLDIQCLSDTSVDVMWPSSPEFVFEMVNRDTGGESFSVTVGGSYRSGRFGRVTVEARDSGGALLPPRDWRSLMGGGMSTRQRLRPCVQTPDVPLPATKKEEIAEETLDEVEDEDADQHGPCFSVKVDAYVEFPGPGSYVLRVLLHDDVTIADEGAAGYVVSSSPELHVDIRPLEIELTRAELAETRGWVKQIDATQSVPTIAEPWRADLQFVGPPTTAQDSLFRAGWRSVPALVEALDDETLAPRHRGWVLGLLAAITGRGCANFPGAGMGTMELGDTIARMNWPTTKEGVIAGDRGYGGGRGAPSPDRQQVAAEEWRGLRRFFVLSIRD